MGWLIGPTIASAMVAYVAVRIFSYIFGEASSGAANVARAGVFVSTWTAVTAGMGMRSFDKRVRKLRSLTQSGGMRKLRALTRVKRQ